MTSNTIDAIGMNPRPDLFSLRQYLWGPFPFSRELPERPNIHRPRYCKHIRPGATCRVPLALAGTRTGDRIAPDGAPELPSTPCLEVHSVGPVILTLPCLWAVFL